MHCGTLLILSLSITLVRNFPVQVFDYIDPVTGQHELIEVHEDDDYPSSGHKQTKKSILEPCLRSQNGDVKCFFEDDARKSRFEENLRVSMLPYYYGRDTEIYNQPYEDFYQEPYFEESPQGLVAVEQTPFVNPGSNPSYGTYIHGLEEPQELDTSAYESNDMLPLNLRMTRRTSYEDWLDQLSHDAMMNNILPTMSYVRSSGDSGYGVPYNSAPLAYFPGAGAVNCAQPILFGCSPSIVQGRIAHRPSLPDYAIVPQLQLNKPGHLITNNKQGHDKVVVPVLPNQDYRTRGLASG